MLLPFQTLQGQERHIAFLFPVGPSEFGQFGKDTLDQHRSIRRSVRGDAARRQVSNMSRAVSWASTTPRCRRVRFHRNRAPPTVPHTRRLASGRAGPLRRFAVECTRPSAKHCSLCMRGAHNLRIIARSPRLCRSRECTELQFFNRSDVAANPLMGRRHQRVHRGVTVAHDGRPVEPTVASFPAADRARTTWYAPEPSRVSLQKALKCRSISNCASLPSKRLHSASFACW